MTAVVELIAEARAAGLRLRFDGERLEAYSAGRPPDRLLQRLRADRAAVARVLQAEQLLLDWSTSADWIVDDLAELETSAELRTKSRELFEAVLDQPDTFVEALFPATRAQLDEIIELPTDPILGSAGPLAREEYRQAHRRLRTVLGDAPDAGRIPWAEFKPLELARRSAFHQTDEDRALRFLVAWENCIRVLILHHGRKNGAG